MDDVVDVIPAARMRDYRRRSVSFPPAGDSGSRDGSGCRVTGATALAEQKFSGDCTGGLGHLTEGGGGGVDATEMPQRRTQARAEDEGEGRVVGADVAHGGSFSSKVCAAEVVRRDRRVVIANVVTRSDNSARDLGLSVIVH